MYWAASGLRTSIWLQTREVRSYITKRARGASPTMKKINQSDIGQIPFPDVDMGRQTEAVAILDAIKAEIDEMRETEKNDTILLAQMEQAILTQAFRGEL